jgi:glycerol-3-phosphate dehydrogenase (NAD(P)+)
VTQRVAVIGAGSWGTALANVLAANGTAVRVWSHDPSVARQISDQARNDKYLPGVALEAHIEAFDRFEPVLDGATMILYVSPSQVIRELLESIRPLVGADAILVSASKGLELNTGLRMTEVIAQVLGPELGAGAVVVSGPSFATELARRLPTAIAAASKTEENAHRVQEALQAEYLRVYTQSDVIGTELGGSLKNIIALASGISDGLGLGNNARAALLTRGLAEMVRLTTRLGGHEATLSGLAGLGDLVLTCTGDLSRNRQVGLAVGRGEALADVLAGMQQVAEGVLTTRAARSLAAGNDVEMPIVEAVYAILFEAVPPRQVLAELMARAPKPERWS